MASESSGLGWATFPLSSVFICKYSFRLKSAIILLSLKVYYLTVLSTNARQNALYKLSKFVGDHMEAINKRETTTSHAGE